MASTWSFEAQDNVDTAHGFAEHSPSLLLYAMLPSLLQRRIPRLRSLRRAATGKPESACHSRMSSCSTAVEQMTPPPSYRSVLPSSDDSEEEEPNFFPPFPATSPASQSSSRPSSSDSMAPPFLGEFRSGIQWKYAEAGYSMLSLASHEASTTQPGANLVRRQYISGVSCVLRGLPLDLTDDEQLSLREALPPALLQADLSRNAMVHSADPSVSRGRRASASLGGRTALQSMVATLTFYIFLAVTFVLPYIQLFFRQAYQFDRKHKISDKVLAQSVATADAVGRGAIVLAGNVCAMHDGKVGEVMKEAGMYVVQSFSGGVYDGLGDGMQALGLRTDSAPKAASTSQSRRLR